MTEDSFKIVDLTDDYRQQVFDMMRDFYDSPALIHKSSDKVLNRDLDDCIGDNPLLHGYVFIENDQVIGYSMVSKNYTTEYGGLCIWVEDLYFKEGYRNQGKSEKYFKFLENAYPEAVRFKLEVEKENERAVNAYYKNGYDISQYFLMTKEIDKDS